MEFQRNTDQQLNLSNLGGVETVEDVEDVEEPEPPCGAPADQARSVNPTAPFFAFGFQCFQ